MQALYFYPKVFVKLKGNAKVWASHCDDKRDFDRKINIRSKLLLLLLTG